mmetsp:Transcript_16325/g.41709  ORF Transcript_16325/g.41709 Transcript_16325/m.41709 type:complete len:651 (-) Transcript_16325:11-1963(-)
MLAAVSVGGALVVPPVVDRVRQFVPPRDSQQVWLLVCLVLLLFLELWTWVSGIANVKTTVSRYRGIARIMLGVVLLFPIKFTWKVLGLYDDRNGTLTQRLEKQINDMVLAFDEYVGALQTEVSTITERIAEIMNGEFGKAATELGFFLAPWQSASEGGRTAAGEIDRWPEAGLRRQMLASLKTVTSAWIGTLTEALDSQADPELLAAIARIGRASSCEEVIRVAVGWTHRGVRVDIAATRRALGEEVARDNGGMQRSVAQVVQQRRSQRNEPLMGGIEPFSVEEPVRRGSRPDMALRTALHRCTSRDVLNCGNDQPRLGCCFLNCGSQRYPDAETLHWLFGWHYARWAPVFLGLACCMLGYYVAQVYFVASLCSPGVDLSPGLTRCCKPVEGRTDRPIAPTPCREDVDSFLTCDYTGAFSMAVCVLTAQSECQKGCVYSTTHEGMSDVFAAFVSLALVLGCSLMIINFKRLVQPMEQVARLRTLVQQGQELQSRIEAVENRNPVRRKLMYWNMSTIPRLNVMDWVARLWMEGPGVQVDQADGLDSIDRFQLAEVFEDCATLFAALGPASLRRVSRQSALSGAAGDGATLSDGLQHRQALHKLRRETLRASAPSVVLFGPQGWVARASLVLGGSPESPTDLAAVPFDDGAA